MSPRRPPAPDRPPVPGPSGPGDGGGRGPARGSTEPGRGINNPVRGSKPLARPAKPPRSATAPIGRPTSTRPRSAATGKATGRPGTRAGSGRQFWVLGAVAVLLAVLILPYFQKWLGQRSQIEAARSQVSRAQQDVATLEAERRRWQDEEYVRAQARKRLNYVMPGEIGFVVKDAPDSAGTDPRERAAVVARGDKTPWYSDVWKSAEVAGKGSSGAR